MEIELAAGAEKRTRKLNARKLQIKALTLNWPPVGYSSPVNRAIDLPALAPKRGVPI